jgi:large subunit ribosomal protein L25|tara:strand:+ start:999 stop:1700 length:702 start_codon:yes stop_codon:yes gene_type:complete
MNTIDASVRDTKTKGQVRALRKNGNVPAIVYGGSEQNEKVSVSKKTINALISKENFLSNILTLNINGKTQNVLPKELKYNVVTDDIIHIDFVRLLEGAKIILNIPVKFINNEKSPGLKRGGVLNIVRRKVELKCPTENIPSELVVDLDGVDIGESFKISSIKLPENVVPVIQGRDFVIATLAAPTVMKEPEKPTETAEAATESAEGETKSAETENKDGDKKDSEDKKSPAEKK